MSRASAPCSPAAPRSADARALSAAQESLYAQIDAIGARVNPRVGCFHDGVAFPDAYLATKPRIAWVLKNAYDESDADGAPVSDGMDIRDWFCDGALAAAGKKQLFIKMALVSHCVQRGVPYRADGARDKAAVMRALQGIALVDLSKLPGGKSITDRALKAEAAHFAEVVAAQVALYQPDVLIFGNTLHLCHGLFPDVDYAHPARVYEAGGDCVLRAFCGTRRLYLEAYHPSYPASYDAYVGTLVQAVRDHSAQ